MKILVVGPFDVSHLVQNVAIGFSKHGLTTEVFNTKEFRRINKYIYSNFQRNIFSKKLRNFKPDIIFVVAPLFVQQSFWEEIYDYKSITQAIVFGWVGDTFIYDEHKDKFQILDKIFITDTGFSILFPDHIKSIYLPLATNPDIFFNTSKKRDLKAVFIASYTPNRAEVLKSIKTPIIIAGNGWNNKGLDHHKIFRGVPIKKTADFYKSNIISINVTNEFNLVSGVNQRSFDPCSCGAISIHYDCIDLEKNFVLGEEVLSYKNTSELNLMISNVLQDYGSYVKVAERGQERVLDEHTFFHRIGHVIRSV